MNKPFFDEVRHKLFGGTLTQEQVDGMNAIWKYAKDLPITYQAYLLATAYHETGKTMEPIREAFGKTDAQSIARLDSAWRRGKLPQVSKPYWRLDADGRAWFGRGLVQLTFKHNYKKASQLVGIDLVKNPGYAMKLDVAAKILVKGCEAGLFTGKKLSDYLPGDYYGARRVVNGLDRANLIAKYAEKFEKALRKI